MDQGLGRRIDNKGDQNSSVPKYGCNMEKRHEKQNLQNGNKTNYSLCRRDTTNNFKNRMNAGNDKDEDFENGRR